MSILRITVITIPLLIATACGGRDEVADTDRDQGDHVWREQVQVLEKARDVDRMMQEQSERRRREIEKQGG